MLALDTNHLSELTYRTAAGLKVLGRLDAAGEDAAVTAISDEESLRDWLAVIRRRNDPKGQKGQIADFKPLPSLKVENWLD